MARRSRTRGARPAMHALLSLAAVVLASSVGFGASPAPSAAASPVSPAVHPASPAPDAFDANAARSECEEKGGQVQERRAAWNTNADPSAWLMLAGDIEFCRFQTLGTADDSRIYVDLRTLTAHGPTLASVAYLSKVPVDTGTKPTKHKGTAPPSVGMANPATLYCTSLGGSSSFGGGAAGGGWVNLDDPIDKVVAMCVFPDGSMIDEWGLTYHAGDAVRGADLAPLFDYQPGAELPPIF
jgi:putative hemolysin